MRVVRLGRLAAWSALWLVAAEAAGQGPPIRSAGQLVGLSPARLDALYRQGRVGAVPAGKVRGVALIEPGTAMGPTLTKAARVMWQGKVFRPDEARAVNRFFGLRVVRAAVSHGPSWRDGGSALILDYQGTSVVYRNVRDEVREIAPGVYLGLMYARTEPCPTLKMYFALEDPSRCGEMAATGH